MSELPLAPEDHRAATRRTIAILAICGFASTFAMRFIDPMIGVIARDLRSDPHSVALLATAFALPYALVQPILGPVGDALGKERIIKICLTILTVTLALGALASDLDTLFFLRVLSGAAGGGIIPLALATIGDRVEMGERQVAISRFLLFSISGQLIGGSVAGLMADLFGWRGVFAAVSGIAFLASVAVFIGFRRASVTGGRFTLSVAVSRYTRILRIPRALALFAFVFFEGIFIFGIQPHIAPLLEARGAGGPTQAGLVIACFAAGGVLYTLLVRLLLGVLGLSRMLFVAGLLGGAAFLTLAADSTWRVDAGAMLMMGVGFYMLHNSFQTQVTELVPDSRASAVSLHAFSYFVGQAIGPALFGVGLVGLGDSASKIICGIAVVAIGCTAAYVFRFAQPRPR